VRHAGMQAGRWPSQIQGGHTLAEMTMRFLELAHCKSSKTVPVLVFPTDSGDASGVTVPSCRWRLLGDPS
jgi:hypothetical protein